MVISKTDMVVSKLYAQKMLPRSHVAEIIDFTSYYNSILFDPLRKICKNINSTE